MYKHILTCLLAISFLLPSTALATDKVHDCLVIVLDASGSMDETMPDPDNAKGASRKMDVAKRSLKGVITQVPEGTHVGLVVFNGGNIRFEYDLGPVDVGRFNLAVDGVRANGGTPLGESMKDAADRLMEERDDQMNAGSYKMLVITDGEAGRGTDLMIQNTNEIVARGIRVDTIGVAMEGGKDHTLANLTHSYQGASDSVSLETALLKAVSAEVSADDPIDYNDFAGLEADVAKAWITALTQAKPNHGIGERAPEPVVEQPSSSSSSSAPQQSQPASCSSSGSSMGNLSLLIIVLTGMLAVTRRKHAFEAR